MLAWLHATGKVSQRWQQRSDAERELIALSKMLDRATRWYLRLLNQLEAEMARVWPEAPKLLPLKRTSLLTLLKEIGGPGSVAADRDAAASLLKRAGRSFLKPDKVSAVIDSAVTTQGVSMLGLEEENLSDLASGVLQAKAKKKKLERRMNTEARKRAAATLCDFAGGPTTGIFYAAGLDPSKFEAPAQLLKAFGLNLWENSSGTGKVSGLHISKRGSGRARRWLFLLALRTVEGNAIVESWYRKKVARDGGKVKMKAIVAVMRKLVRAIWHVGRGECFDASKLFDTDLLVLTP